MSNKHQLCITKNGALRAEICYDALVLFDAQTLPEYLKRQGLVAADADVTVTALTGGVSSAINLVQAGDREFVAKQALEKLNVKDDWFCDPKRNLYEQAFLALAQKIMPGATPELLWRDPDNGLFLMEYLGGEWLNWKVCLMQGDLREPVAAIAGRTLAMLHAQTWQNAAIAAQFDNTALFHELRISPYLLTAAERNPALSDWLQQESTCLAETRLALVHGDYSPKNLLTDGAALKILDAEVAWFGDPAFDAAFLLNHLYLKALHRRDRTEGFARLRQAFLKTYAAGMGAHWSEDYEARISRLVLMLMLARVTSKSPVEYLAPDGPEARWIIDFVTRRHTQTLNTAVLEQAFRQDWQ